LPAPAWDQVDLDARDRFLSLLGAALGRGAHSFAFDGRTLPVITSRGCPYRCAHCSSNPGLAAGAPKIQRRLSPARVEALIAHVVDTHGATRVSVLDEMVNVEADHFDALLAALTPRSIAYDFPNGMRADRLTASQLQQMAGRVQLLSVSAESGVQRVIDEVVGKRLDLAALEATVARATSLGIPTLVHFIIGMPGETAVEINATLEWALHLYQEYGAWPAVQFATPLPGTQLAAAAAGVDVPDFSPLFQHTPSTSGDGFDPDILRRFAWTFQQRLAAGREPTKVIVNLTYRCNNRCSFCAVGNRGQDDGEYRDQLEILAKYRAKGLTEVDFDGGEPTLYPHLVNVVRAAKKLGYQSVHVTSNGRMCAYEGYAQRLVNSGLTSLLFSVHGHNEKLHARNVGVPEAFEQTVNGIRNCVRLAPDSVELGMNVTVTRSNVAYLQATAQLAWDLGLRWLNMQLLTPFGRCTTVLDPGEAAVQEAVPAVIDAWRDRMKLQVINSPYCLLPGYEEFVTGDLMKVQRHMVFTNNEQVNLADYLRERRAYEPKCHGCPHKVFCGGFYKLKDSPEPPWDGLAKSYETGWDPAAS